MNTIFIVKIFNFPARGVLIGCRDREEYREDNCYCAGRTSGCGAGNGLFVVHKISFQEKAPYLQVWWIERLVTY